MNPPPPPPHDPPENVNNANANDARYPPINTDNAYAQTSPRRISPIYPNSNINLPIHNDPRGNFVNNYRPHFRNSSTPVDPPQRNIGFRPQESTTLDPLQTSPHTSPHTSPSQVDQWREQRNRLEE